MARSTYPSDLSDREWQLLEPLLPPPQARRSTPEIPRREIVNAIRYVLRTGYPRREIVNAIRYVLRTGCAWRMLPHDLSPWRIVFHYFRTWRRDGTWQRANDTLHSSLRQSQGRPASPSAAIIDSQSVKSGEKGGQGATTLARR